MSKQEEIINRVKKEAKYMSENRTTVRQTAKEFKISKTTVHDDITQRLKKVDGELYKEVREVIDYNISQRAIRGGTATKEKYKK